MSESVNFHTCAHQWADFDARNPKIRRAYSALDTPHLEAVSLAATQTDRGAPRPCQTPLRGILSASAVMLPARASRTTPEYS
jgi:hypothetical protein